ncbi:MAG: S8 family serine peptidase [Desulfobacteraceae bacterium]|nr:S8 family serine peptidase [Desulfobacteraceae bacterium]
MIRKITKSFCQLLLLLLFIFYPCSAFTQRLIVELAEPPLASYGYENSKIMANGKLDFKSEESKKYVSSITSLQNKALGKMRGSFSNIRLSKYKNQNGIECEHRYNILLNGFTIDIGENNEDEAIKRLSNIEGVKKVYKVKTYYPTMYASLPLISAPSAWNHIHIGGKNNAGKGIKVAIMDAGIHKDAPMFDGTNFSYPIDYPFGGLGFKSNNNGKIIASRFYYRENDPPTAGDANPWPGADNDSHGVHTGGTAAGNIVNADFIGRDVQLSGVAPQAWVMSYKIFYHSVSGRDTFETPEGIACLEDIIKDGADVLNCSWGGGPFSSGGEFDIEDKLLINAWKSGVFVSTAMGNAGPGKGTGDHPSNDYISVAATTSGGTFAAGSLSLSDEASVPDHLVDMPAGITSFGSLPPVGSISSYPLKTAKSVDPENIKGCSPFPENIFNDCAVVIERGECNFDEKVLNAQNSGAKLVVVYNNSGDEIQDMGPGENKDLIEIYGVFIGQSNGKALENWYEEHPVSSELVFSFSSFQQGNEKDIVADFSSRGPGVGNTLKPDIAAPGVNILSQGYDPLQEGEDAHLGFGQSSGTSMASPQIAGAAAVLKQIYPLWSNDDIKSAMMSTAKYKEIYTSDNKPAQPLDIGAGRIDLERAVDPGVILSPPSLGFGALEKNSTKNMIVKIRNILPENQTFEVNTCYAGDGFDNMTQAKGFSVSPLQISLKPFETKEINVLFEADKSMGVGDNQGYVVLKNTEREVHFPVWARVLNVSEQQDRALLIDLDSSSSDENLNDYLNEYKHVFEAQQLVCDVLDIKINSEEVQIHEASSLSSYKVIVLFSGESTYSPLNTQDMDRLMEYVNMGGLVICMGQNIFSSVLDPFSAFGDYADAKPLNSSVTGENSPLYPVIASEKAPLFFKEFFIDLNPDQTQMDEFESGIFRYSGAGREGDGYVLKVKRLYPSLEAPGIVNNGKVIVSSIGIEGINESTGGLTREGLIRTMLDWAWDEPVIEIKNVTENYENQADITYFEISYDSLKEGVEFDSVRFDFGDGSSFTSKSSSLVNAHSYEKCGTFTVKAEVSDILGNKYISQKDFVIENCLVKDEKEKWSGSSGCFISELMP